MSFSIIKTTNFFIMMSKIQKKSLEHVLSTLKSFNTYPLYDLLYKSLKNYDIIDSDIRDIMGTVNPELHKMKNTVSEAIDWIEVITEDIN